MNLIIPTNVKITYLLIEEITYRNQYLPDIDYEAQACQEVRRAINAWMYGCPSDNE